MLMTMMGVRLAGIATSLPYGALITWISKHAGVPMAGEKQTKPFGALNAWYFLASNSHLYGDEVERRAPRPPWVARRRRAADGASSSTPIGDPDHDLICSTLDGLQQSVISLIARLGELTTEYRNGF